MVPDLQPDCDGVLMADFQDRFAGEVTEAHLEIQFHSKHEGWVKLCAHNPDNAAEGMIWLAEWRAKDSVPKRLARVTTTTMVEEVTA